MYNQVFQYKPDPKNSCTDVQITEWLEENTVTLLAQYISEYVLAI